MLIQSGCVWPGNMNNDAVAVVSSVCGCSQWFEFPSILWHFLCDSRQWDPCNNLLQLFLKASVLWDRFKPGQLDRNWAGLGEKVNYNWETDVLLYTLFLQISVNVVYLTGGVCTAVSSSKTAIYWYLLWFVVDWIVQTSAKLNATSCILSICNARVVFYLLLYVMYTLCIMWV